MRWGCKWFSRVREKSLRIVYIEGKGEVGGFVSVLEREGERKGGRLRERVDEEGCGYN